MPGNTTPRDVRTLGVVMRRTNYGEADRILNLLTPLGKITAIAKGVRKARAKMAGGVEMFTLTDFNIHLGKSEMGVVTGAKMVRHYGEIIKDFGRMEMAGVILKKVNQLAEGSDNSEYFSLVEQSLAGLNSGAAIELVEGWFLINAMRAMGEEMNLYRDVGGMRLGVEKRYDWDAMQMAFSENERGEFTADEIKMLRLMATADLKVVRRVKIDGVKLVRILELIRVASRA